MLRLHFALHTSVPEIILISSGSRGLRIEEGGIEVGRGEMDFEDDQRGQEVYLRLISLVSCNSMQPPFEQERCRGLFLRKVAGGDDRFERIGFLENVSIHFFDECVPTTITLV